MKRYLVAALVATAASQVSAQIPVTDVAAITMHTNNQVQTIAQWTQQNAEMKSQYEEMKRHWDKMDDMEKLVTGARYLGIPNAGGVHDQIPNDPNAIYSGTYGSTQTILNAEKVTDAGDATSEAISARASRAAAAERAVVISTYEGAQARLANIEVLIGKIDEAQDPKAIQDLQARIAAEQALIDNENTKMQLISQLAASEEKLIREQRVQRNACLLYTSDAADE